MNNLIFPILIIIILLIILINNITSQNENSINTFNSPFECGFSNISNSSTLISHNFFTFNIFFLILELEIILVIPFTTVNFNTQLSNFPFYLIITIILITITNEWNNNIIEWSN